MRRIETADKFFDLLDQMGRGKFVTIGYVSGANLNVPTVSRKNPATNRMKKYDDYSVFGENIGALVKITSYNMQYNHRDTVNKKYGEYKQAFNSLRGEFGLDPVQDKQGYKTGSNWGSNGPELYNGGNEDLKSHSYNAQNTYGANIKSITYAVDTNGHIIQELTPEQVKPYIKEKSPISGVKALREMGVEEERIQEYIKREIELHMRYKNFESNSILWIAATINGEKIIYINDRLTRAVNDINIAPEDFIKIAKERYQEDLATLQEMANRYSMKFRLTESELRQVVREAAMKIITEIADPTVKIQQLIQQANEAYHQAIEVQGETQWPLMDKEGNSYGLTGDIRLDGRGYIVIPFNGGSYSPYSPEKIKVLTRVRGRVRIYPGDYMNNGWKDAAKMLKQIIRDAQIGNGHFQNYDPNWEDADTPEQYKANKEALRGMNKQIGRTPNAGMDYISKRY